MVRIRHALRSCLLAIGLLAALTGWAGTSAAQQWVPPVYPPNYRLGPIALPSLGGRYPIGTRMFELARADGTPLGIIAWYPARRAEARSAPYFTDMDKRVTAPAMARSFGWPETMLADFGNLRTNARLDAPIARGRFPLVIFSHGFLMYPRQNSALMERLAAAGYIVLSIGHSGDAADLPSSRGTLPTRSIETVAEPDPEAILAFWMAPDSQTQKKLLPALWRSPRTQAMTMRLDVWRDDLRVLTDAVIGPAVAPALRAIAAAVRPGPYALAGMSFGGSASISTCVRDRRCGAAINLDGIEFDSSLYDRDAGKPLLLLQSDWQTYPNAGPPGRRFTPYDLAYERWATAGRNPDIHRYWLKGIRHMGMSDLILAPRNAERDALLGTIDGARATDAINALCLAFLDRYLARRTASIAAVAKRHPELVRHMAGSAH